MNLRRRRREEPNVNLTPLIDVVFLLLIFFMVSTTFRREADLRLDLPEASRTPAPTEQHLTVSIDAAGVYYVNDQALPDARPETLRQALAAAAGEDRQQPLLLRADGRTPHQAVVTAMDAAGQLGFRRLVIGTVEAPAVSPPEK